MRPIKFRAWHKTQKKMYYPDEMAKDQLTLMPDGRGFINVHGGDTRFSKIYDTMVPLQFTGLLDKSGREIFEGDVVRLKKFIGGNWVDHKIQRFVVVFDKFSFQLKPIDSAIYTVSMVLGDDCEIEIIGSIYEDPELLK